MKFTTVVAYAALLAATPGWAAGGDATAGEAKAAVCAACHGVDGNSVDPQYPKIAGQHEQYIAQQLALFKSGKRENAIMLGFATLLSEQDMADLGAYFSAQQAKPAEQAQQPEKKQSRTEMLGPNLAATLFFRE